MSRGLLLALLALAVVVAAWLLWPAADRPPAGPPPQAAIDGPPDVAEPDATGGDGATGVSPPVAGGCAACLLAHCEAADNACAADPACVSLDGCLFECAPSDDPCTSACLGRHGAGLPGLRALAGCARAHCEDPCYAGLFPGVVAAATASPEARPSPPADDRPPPVPADDDEPAATAPPGPGSLAATAPVPPCASCLGTTCAAQDAACGENRACTALNDCLARCVRDDPACARDCSRRQPAGIRDLEALMDCAQQGCRDACWTDGGPRRPPDVALAAALAMPPPPDDPPPEPEPQTCDACLADACAPQGALCGSIPACLALDDCLGRCGPADAMCMAGCQLRAPGGIPAFRALSDCGWSSCGDPCYGSSGGSNPAWGSPVAQLAALRILAVAADVAWWSGRNPYRSARRGQNCGWACRHGW
jgi:hypothetical protein